MPKWLICIPLVVQWFWLGLRYRSLTLPSAANPFITSGGLVGEGKLEYFRGMGHVARAATARHCGVENDGAKTAQQLLGTLNGALLDFPLIAKPDLGLCGHGVRRIDDMAQLIDYLARFPRGEVVVLQEYLPQEGEAGIFYARDPVTGDGSIIGLALRTFPMVIGDGVRSVAELVAANPRAARIKASARHECRFTASAIPAPGEVVRLATIGSTRVGGLYRDGAQHITSALIARIDTIARDMQEFHFGRFDVRFDSTDGLQAGTGIRIMEVNGAGSEAIDAWDPATGLIKGLRMIFRKQRLAFAIGAARRNEGTRPIALAELARLNSRQVRLIGQYPPSN